MRQSQGPTCGIWSWVPSAGLQRECFSLLVSHAIPENLYVLIQTGLVILQGNAPADVFDRGLDVVKLIAPEDRGIPDRLRVIELGPAPGQIERVRLLAGIDDHPEGRRRGLGPG